MKKLQVEFGNEDVSLTYEEFRNKGRALGKKLFALKRQWAHQFASMPIGEFVKNFYFHAEKKGRICFAIEEEVVLWSVYDFGPGDPEGRGISEIIASIDRKSEKYTNRIPGGPSGLGLMSLQGTLDSLCICPGVAASSWHLETKGRFAYHGLIILDGTGR